MMGIGACQSEAVLDSFFSAQSMGKKSMKRPYSNTAIPPGTSGRALVFLLLLVLFLAAGSAGYGARYERKVVQYTIPDVVLVNQDGEKIRFDTLLNGDKPVILDFIYGTCTTICPVLSIGFSHFQKKLGPEAENVRLVSISIDPDNDTPAVMKEYLERYDAQPGWDFLTGKREDILQVMKAFDAVVINKMDHYPLTFLHLPGTSDWVRINQLLATAELMEEYRLLLKK